MLRNVFLKGLRDRRRSFPVWAVRPLRAARLALPAVAEYP